jgi:hypothetical protein
MANSQNKNVTKMQLSVDSSTHNRPGFIYAKQLDVNSRFIDVTLINSSGVIPVSGLAQLNITRPDGVKKYVRGTINSDNSISFALPSAALEITGGATCDVSVISGGNLVLTSSTFTLIVAESNFSSEEWEDDSDGGNIFSETIAAVATHAAAAQSSASSAATSAQTAQAASDAAASDKESVGEMLQEVTALKEQAEQAAQDAVDAKNSMDGYEIATLDEVKAYLGA